MTATKVGHTPYSELEKKLEDAKAQVEVGGKYFHYKNPSELYKVINIGLLEATEEVCVMYQHPHKKVVWVRSLSNFLETVEQDGKSVPRFTKVSD